MSNNLTTTPLVSVIVNCLNGERYLKKSLDSIYKQTYENFEIIFWNNGSTDRSKLIASEYEYKIRLYSTEETVPLGMARNRAIRKAKGSYIAFLDVDDWWTPRKLEKQINRFNNKDVGLLYCDSTIIENNLKYNHFSLLSPFMGRVGCRLLEANFMTTSSIVYRADVLKSLPVIFRDELSLMVDYELSVRVSFNCEIDYVNEPLAVILKHKRSYTNKNKKEIIKENAQVLKYFYNEKLHVSCPNEIHVYKTNCIIREASMLLDSGDFDNGLKNLQKVKDFSKKYNVLYIILSVLPSIKIYRMLKIIWIFLLKIKSMFKQNIKIHSA